ncbi:ATP-binding protein [Pseudomonas sp. ZM23]|uniref:histidine kinase n=1 Tax=Pseudomonas triclosanedens TaxID=2961893 RepID=A0ABY7A352_9PSED|nr:ATP-binding protein [Pseudomonas triclosanedens]MCP8464958.1 ATP-binding protein [Pseudomonas triclosanedens]MCP8470330.1 ATP-binding protein [Pseudomonas triclosanedens]MCP8476135.1 ATP-binding protein [Pseudomonas triclosanedens]WAI51632.1 ATP-binding protein [Pseudomonas triclosanedens]
MKSIFLRIYGGMLLTLVLVAALGVLALHLVNEVRGERYREDLARGTFRLMADELLPMSEVDRKRALTQWSRLLGIPLRLTSLDALGMEGRSRARLMNDQVLVQASAPHMVKVLTQVSAAESLILTGEVEQVSEQLARATIYLLMDELKRYPASEQPYHLARIVRDKRFGFDVHLLRLKEIDLDDDQSRRVEEGDTVLALGKDGDSIRVLAGILDTPWVLELGPIYQMNPYPPQLLSIIVVVALSLIGLTLYLLISGLEQRLRSLESAATRIARGSLDTRVEARGADSVGRLAGAFNHMAEQLHLLLTVQRELVRAVSHELRTPVARLRFGLEMIESAETDVARRKYMEGMDGDIQDLDQLVDEMLTYARLEQGSPALTYQRLELAALVTQVVSEIAPLRREITVSIEPGPLVPFDQGSWVEAEPRYLHRALQNLLTNALRYAESRVRVSFRLSVEQCQVDVEDDGPGVPEVQWPRLFQPFFRADDSRARVTGGHGLGLSIVRRIIHWHGGRAQIAHSESLGGACFTLVWPRRQAPRGE